MIILSIVFGLLSPGAVTADDIRQDALNPIANLGKFVIRNEANYGVDPFDKTKNSTLIEAVIPVKVSENWRLMVRPIIPLINQPKLTSAQDTIFGLGDIDPFFFFTRKNAIDIGGGGWLVLGVGSQLTFPTATDRRLGSGKYSAGPAAIMTVLKGPLVYGAGLSNKWSFTGDDKRANVNAMIFEPFANYIMKDGWYLTSTPVITANWEADDDNRWNVPLGGGVGRVFKIGNQPVDAQLQSFYNVVSPDNGGADWSMSFQFTFLFPE